MPLYEYECEKCRQRTEALQKFSDAPLTECGQCGGPLRKLISSPAIQFKGSGFYITDYGKGGSSSASTSSSSSSSSESKSSESKSDTATSKSTETKSST